ncbi:Membrane-associated phospholipid phosphatase [Mucilaginibacter pineti]|uniref:Membrane-associated phospholipid phosphatase n=1 Tax=Mucilaginibacter pineti TaxID=1391627 RepID=A0A1G6WIA9_9SPHI|nr:phosphatase PAP2 family protein [Mucilaginibacter pineti]SDD64786.1 Membrane-associated phospholipid phosphatase [Mucilaginibacter pineti]
MKIGIKDVLQRIWPFFILYLLLLSICLTIKMLYTREVIYFAVNGWNSPWADYIEPYITDLGDGITAITLSLIMLLFSYRKFLLLASSYAITAIVAQILKFIFDAPRPKVYFQDQWDKVHTVKGLYILSTHSFPSGHTVSAFSAALVITYLCKNKGWGIPALLIAILIGYSRMYLTQHFFEDVMAGSVIGVMVTVFWLTWLDGRQFIHTPGWTRGLLQTIRKK